MPKDMICLLCILSSEMTWIHSISCLTFCLKSCKKVIFTTEENLICRVCFTHHGSTDLPLKWGFTSSTCFHHPTIPRVAWLDGLINTKPITRMSHKGIPTWTSQYHSFMCPKIPTMRQKSDQNTTQLKPNNLATWQDYPIGTLSESCLYKC